MARYRSPNGSEIVGTAEQVLATANVSGIDPHTGEPEYAGDTEIHWDTQVTLTRDRKILFVDDNGDEWTFDQLTMIEGSDDES